MFCNKGTVQLLEIDNKALVYICCILNLWNNLLQQVCLVSVDMLPHRRLTRLRRSWGLSITSIKFCTNMHDTWQFSLRRIDKESLKDNVILEGAGENLFVPQLLITFNIMKRNSCHLKEEQFFWNVSSLVF